MADTFGEGVNTYLELMRFNLWSLVGHLAP